MKELDYQIGGREFSAIILLTIGVKLADTTPSLLMNVGGVASWMIPWVSVGVTTVSFLFLLPLLRKYKNKGLVDIINQITGKYIGFFLNFLLFMTVFLTTIVNSHSYVEIISGLFFKKTPIIVLLATLVLTYYFVASKGFDTIGRVAWLITPYIKVVLWIFPILVWQSLDFSFIYPIFGPGEWEVLKQGVNMSSVFADVIVIAVLFPYVKNFKTFRNSTFISLGLVTIEMSMYLFLFVIAFGYPTIDKMSFPFQQLTRLATIGVGVQHVESLFLGFWVMASVVHFATYLYTSTALYCYSFKMKSIEPMLLPFAGLIILGGLTLPNISVDLLIRGKMLVFGSYLIFPLPVVLLCIDKIKGAFQK